MDLLARARELEAQGRDIVHMEIGEPDFVTPQRVIAAARKALDEGHTHYTPALGLPQLRQALSDWYRRRFDADVPASRIVITPGSSTGLQMMIAALVNPGEEVLLPDPGYPCNRNFVHLCDAEPVSLPVTEENGWIPDVAMVDDYWSDKTRALIVASPANPTGAMLSQAQIRDLGQAVAERDGFLIVDEIYQGLTYGEESSTALSRDIDNLFVVDSFSKYFSMTGWRIGWLVVPEAFVPVMDRLAQNLYLSAPVISQYAAIEALSPETEGVLEERREEYRNRRDYLYPRLHDIGFGMTHSPDGAFYLYADCSRFTDDSFTFCRQLLEEAGVAVTPGRDFGENRPETHLRFAYTTTLEKLEIGIERIREFVSAG